MMIKVINIKKNTIIAEASFLKKLSPIVASKLSHRISEGAVGLLNLKIH